jgi:hypothetical protein
MLPGDLELKMSELWPSVLYYRGHCTILEISFVVHLQSILPLLEYKCLLNPHYSQVQGNELGYKVQSCRRTRGKGQRKSTPRPESTVDPGIRGAMAPRMPMEGKPACSGCMEFSDLKSLRFPCTCDLNHGQPAT